MQLEIIASAAARARASTSSTDSRLNSPPELFQLFMTSPMTRAMPPKFKRPSRNACTATSLAAFRTAGISPPSRAASRAIPRQGNRPKSGGSKSRRATCSRSRNCTPASSRCGHARACAMGVRMSGEPSWARTDPSTYSTRECTTLCRCITTSIRSAAGRTAGPPLSAPGPCSSASRNPPRSCDPWTSSDGRRPGPGSHSPAAAPDQSLNGPPDAVSSILRTPAGAVPSAPSGGRHWKMALCSLSMGISCAPERAAASSTRRPDMMMASLFATIRRLPAPAAASVERRPAAPTIAAITYGCFRHARQLLNACRSGQHPGCQSGTAQALLQVRALADIGQRGIVRPELLALGCQPFHVAVRRQTRPRETGPDAGPARPACSRQCCPLIQAPPRRSSAQSLEWSAGRTTGRELRPAGCRTGPARRHVRV